MTDEVDGTLRFDLSVPPGVCGICRTAPPADEERLTLGLSDGHTYVTVVACRSCLAEYHPELLAAIEEDPDGFFDVGGPS